jgi:hypothetical protein
MTSPNLWAKVIASTSKSQSLDRHRGTRAFARNHRAIFTEFHSRHMHRDCKDLERFGLKGCSKPWFVPTGATSGSNWRCQQPTDHVSIEAHHSVESKV